MTPFLRSLRFVRRWEGGWSDHAQDPGGKTNHGITLATYTNWRRSQGLPDPSADDLRAISEEEVEAIYQQNYWDACRCDDLPPPIALLVFDMAVNAGPSRSARLLQEALGVTVDGIIGRRLSRLPMRQRRGRSPSSMGRGASSTTATSRPSRLLASAGQ